MESLLFLLGLLLGVILGAVGAVVLLGRLRREPEDDDRDQLREAWHAAQLDAEAAKARLQALEQRRDDDAEAARERESLVEMLHPVRQGVTEMQRRIQELEKERAAQHAALSRQLTEAAHNDQKLYDSTQTLLGSLHSTSARGYWGEVQLRRIVEAAGMIPHVDFVEQHTGTGGDGAMLRPDMVVRLPGNRQLIIDAKAPLSPEDPAAQAKALRHHVGVLASKDYASTVEHSPEVIFCFVPAESLLSSALEAEPELLDHALSRGVSLVSPASLLAALKAVETSWRQERLAQNIREIVEHSRELYRRLAKMNTHLSATGNRLRQAVSAYNQLIGNMERQVLPKVETISRLQLAPTEDEPGGDEQAPLEDLGETLTLDHVDAEVNDLGPRLSRGAE
ncbi:DNA recombination protein RmuC [Nesterenkonia sp. CL21]|nr:DNA recombination protein RmuC [Nesterenkonia sp. CL21]MDS2173843.1 DNA recombination protein RmuC [Nesterenkonia sp. CL21]